jgi:hypothetical protein
MGLTRRTELPRSIKKYAFSPLCYTDDFYSYYICPLLSREFIYQRFVTSTLPIVNRVLFYLCLTGFIILLSENFCHRLWSWSGQPYSSFFRWKQLAWKLQKLFKHRTQYFSDFSDKKMTTKSNLKRTRETLLIQIIKP